MSASKVQVIYPLKIVFPPNLATIDFRLPAGFVQRVAASWNPPFHHSAAKFFRPVPLNYSGPCAIGRNPARKRPPERPETRTGETNYAPLNRKLRRRRQTLWRSMLDPTGAFPARRSIGFHEVVCRLAFFVVFELGSAPPVEPSRRLPVSRLARILDELGNLG